MAHDVDDRSAELQSGEPPKDHVAFYVQNDACIQQAKLHFANFLAVYNVVPLPVGFPDADAWLDSEICRYIAHQAHHIGVGNWSGLLLFLIDQV